MRILRTNDVTALTGLSRSTLWRYVRDGIFPESISLGPGAVGWLESDIAEWIEGRRASRRRERQRESTPHQAEASA